ncbi:MAG TPA: HhH-GPD-type base excision DNA repair protein [Ornithinimicrobium sp.]|uniref:HhH-GPD-type base excision DNA repair protein n=1 Tax=Ornithinimicrobium sp. TaxID=1977084 RepID=UPI002B49CFEE|nr:HhH-GPD-type base excision DNA repair protein [Ornithinimicrobium sp.]HKJ11004.1 HhH-GPD-type base excision DNA repair protein [Ornithinimicrobium sp.]
MSTYLHLVGDAEADRLLSQNPFALLVGMLLDQQIPMEVAFAGPRKLAERLGSVDPAMIALMDPDEFVTVCATPPAVHRFPASMGRRVHDLATAVMRDYQGDTAGIWTCGEPDGRTVLKRLKALPGFGDQKARIFVALLGKQCGLQAAGWREAAGDYGQDGTTMSIADVVDEDSLDRVRQWKKEKKAAAKAAQPTTA